MLGTVSNSELNNKLKKDSKKNLKSDPKATSNKMESWAYRLWSRLYQRSNTDSVLANVKEYAKYTVAHNSRTIRSQWQKLGTKNLQEEVMVGTPNINILIVDVIPGTYMDSILNLACATNQILVVVTHNHSVWWKRTSIIIETIPENIIIKQTISRAIRLGLMSNHTISHAWITQTTQPFTFPEWIGQLMVQQQTEGKNENHLIESASCLVTNNIVLASFMAKILQTRILLKIIITDTNKSIQFI